MLIIDYIVNNLSIHQNVITGPSSENDRLLSGKLSNALVCYVVTLNVSFILYLCYLSQVSNMHTIKMTVQIS